MKIYLAQINPIVGDLRGNTQKIISHIEGAKKDFCDLIVFPEMALTGYPPQDLLFIPTFIEDVFFFSKQIQEATAGITALVGLPRKNLEPKGNPLYNSCAIFQNGLLIDFYDKRLLPSYDVFNERRYFQEGEKLTIFDICGKKIAITICEDIWQEPFHQIDPIQELKKKKIDLLINLSASPYWVGKRKLRQEMAKRCAQEIDADVLLVNQVGANENLIFDGNSHFVSLSGEVLVELPLFQETCAIIDLDDLQKKQLFRIDPYAELFQALSLGLKDYCHKSGIFQVVLGLSGGIDSSLVAAIAVNTLGKENVTGIMMPSRYSTPSSLIDAEKLATALQIKTHILPIEAPHDAILQLLSTLFPVTNVNFTEENIQTRIRSLLLMAFSNQCGSVLINTGNKSEMAVGYATLYGDMCGALSVIGDLTKGEVYRLSKWINREQEIIPKNVFIKSPSAELRPDQKDSDTLPPYPTLDAIVIGYIEDHLSPHQISKKHKLPLPLVQEWVDRINKNEYKRRQAPPILKVTTKAFQIGRHYPIVAKFTHS